MTDILIASSLAHAEGTAEVDWGWKRVARLAGLPTWQTPAGNFVVYRAVHPGFLDGVNRNTKIYVGYFTARDRNYHYAIDSMTVRQIAPSPPPLRQAQGEDVK